MLDKLKNLFKTDNTTVKIVMAVIAAVAFGLGVYFVGFSETVDVLDDLGGDEVKEKVVE